MFSLLALTSVTLLAQAPLAFEVASIRPSDPIIPNANTQISAGVTIDHNQFRANYLAFRDYLMMAYDSKPRQVEGPDWIKSERFDILATMPSRDTAFTEKELGVMMKALLEDRFQLKIRREKKDLPVYALVQMKDGIKAVESALDAARR
jgi:uncharacterized protein (TIGR03435 family)